MPTEFKALGVIPARFDSSRFPGKVLVDVFGKPLLQRVYENALQSKMLDRVVVATDDERVYKRVKAFGGEVVLTDKGHQSGTDRCAEVAAMAAFQGFDLIINIQGDEPFIQPGQIDKLVKFLRQNKTFAIGTLAKKIGSREDLFSPHVVKVVFSPFGQALYFSRNAIPYLRDVALGNWLDEGAFYKHIGLYGFQKAALLTIAQLPISRLEKLEKLEQLRWLENGQLIGVEVTEMETTGIDTPQDLEAVLSKGAEFWNV